MAERKGDVPDGDGGVAAVDDDGCSDCTHLFRLILWGSGGVADEPDRVVGVGVGVVGVGVLEESEEAEKKVEHSHVLEGVCVMKHRLGTKRSAKEVESSLYIRCRGPGIVMVWYPTAGLFIYMFSSRARAWSKSSDQVRCEVKVWAFTYLA